MDPLTQGALGAALPQATCRNVSAGVAGGLGFLAGMAADLDVLFRSSTDPLLFLEYHRQFTHSLVFIPIGGLLSACVLHWILGRRWKLGFRQTALFCTLGYATHALLDAATSYGTMLLWPFSDERFAWKIISVVDPLFSLPIAGLVALAALKRKPVFACFALVWAGIYLALGAIQHQTALKMGRDIAESRGHTPVRLEVKPSFGNILVWKTLYEAADRYYVDAVRAGIAPKVYPGASVAKLDIARDLPWLEPGSQQAIDIERFRRFSDGFISLDPVTPNSIIDVRYSLIPNEVAALWSIEVDRNAAQTDHVRFHTHRENASRRMGNLWNLMLGHDG